MTEAAYFLTFTCYGTWLHGDERGSVHRHRGELGPEEGWRRANEALLDHPAIALSAAQRAAVEQAIREVADHRNWRLLALNVRTNHVHIVLYADVLPDRAMAVLKAWSTRRLREAGLWDIGRLWTRGGSTRWLNDETSISGACTYVEETQDERRDPNQPRA